VRCPVLWQRRHRRISSRCAPPRASRSLSSNPPRRYAISLFLQLSGRRRSRTRLSRPRVVVLTLWPCRALVGGTSVGASGRTTLGWTATTDPAGTLGGAALLPDRPGVGAGLPQGLWLRPLRDQAVPERPRVGQATSALSAPLDHLKTLANKRPHLDQYVRSG